MSRTAELHQADSEIERIAQPYVDSQPRFHLDLLDYATVITFLFGIGGIVYALIHG